MHMHARRLGWLTATLLSSSLYAAPTLAVDTGDKGKGAKKFALNPVAQSQLLENLPDPAWENADGKIAEITVTEPPQANSWMGWGGAMGPELVAPVSGEKHDTLKVAEDRVLWVGVGSGCCGQELRLLKTDRDTHTVEIIDSQSISQLLEPYGLDTGYSWYQGSHLFQKADGSVVLVARSGNGGLVWLTLDLNGDTISVSGTTVPVSVPGSGLFGDSAQPQVAAVPAGDDRYLLAFNASRHGITGASAPVSPWGSVGAGFSLSGDYVESSSGVTLLASDSAPGTIEWQIDLVAGETVHLGYYQITPTEEVGDGPQVIWDLSQDPAVIEPMDVQSYRSTTWQAYNNGTVRYETRHQYEFLSPVTARVTVRMSAPATQDVTISGAGFGSELAITAAMRSVDLSTATPTLGEIIPIPSDHPTGGFLGNGTYNLTHLEGDRYLLSVGGTGDPNRGVERVVSRVVTDAPEGLLVGEWSESLPSSIGADRYFSVAFNSDTQSEGMFASSASEIAVNAGDPEGMHDEPIVSNVAVTGDSLTLIDSRRLQTIDSSPNADIAYLGSNEYLHVTRGDVWDELNQEWGEMHTIINIFKTDGQGHWVEQSVPVDILADLNYTSIDILDENHILITWARGYDTMASRILYKN